MVLTKIKLAENQYGIEAFEYINLDQIIQIELHGDHYDVTMDNNEIFRVDLTDNTVITLMTNADTNYVS